jgi:hypothetical protein
MKKFLLLPILLVLILPMAWAQQGMIKGTLVDSASAPLPSATVVLLQRSDSSLVNFAASGPDGSFEIKNVKHGVYLLKVTYVGFATYTQEIDIRSTNLVYDLRSIILKPALKQLDEVEVQAEKAPVTIKKDTIEFNATAFKTKQNAVVEDLLKKLPGVEVDNDGTIRAQGEQVQRVTVDGKNFFGNDPKLATRNLPADAINKIQVYDKKSDQTAFSGIDDGQREKTINLELKEEKRNGAFGNVLAGVGSNDRYQAKANLNRFKKGQQLSFLGMANNINEQGFGIDDYMNFTGGSQQMMQGGAVRLQVNGNNQNGVPLNFGGRTSGIMKNYAGGLNFNETFNKKTELNGSYFYNHLDHNTIQTTDRINFFPTGNLTYKQNSNQQNTNENHRVNTILDHKIDSLNSLKWTNGITYNSTSTFQNSKSRNLAADSTVQNESNRNTFSDGSSFSVNGTLLWRHKFGKKGRTLSTSLQYSLSNSDRHGKQDAQNTYNNEESAQRLLQTNSQSTDNTTYSGTLSYTEPLGKRKYLEVNYTFRQNLNDVNRKVYDINNDESVLNTNLSSLYNSDYQYHKAGLNFRINRTKYNITVGSSYQETSLRGDLKLVETKISKSYKNLLPVARFNYDFATTKHLRFDYETSMQEPTIQQLQPVVDNSDPLNLTVGNPNLRPAYKHEGRLHFTTFDPAKFMNFFAFVDATYTKNAITTAQQYNEQQVRTSKPVNVDHNFSVNGNADFGFPIQKLGSRINLSSSITHQSGTNVINNTESNISQNSIGGTLRYNYRYKEMVDLSASANITRQSTNYEFNKNANQLYFNKTFSGEANITIHEYYQLNTSLDYLIYESKTTNYSQRIPMLNIAISRFILKAKSGEIRLAVNNLLNKNFGVSQTSDVNYFQQQYSNTLGRYYMITFVYAINKQLNPMGARPPRGPMMRIIR